MDSDRRRLLLGGLATLTFGALPRPGSARPAFARTGLARADAQPVLVLVQLGGSAVEWQVRLWCKTEDFWTVKEHATNAVKAALDAAGIGIPYPQMDVHLDSPPKAA